VSTLQQPWRAVDSCRVSVLTELKKLSIGVKPRKKIIQAMEDYRQGIMPNLYGRFSDASPDDGQK